MMRAIPHPCQSSIPSLSHCATTHFSLLNAPSQHLSAQSFVIRTVSLLFTFRLFSLCRLLLSIKSLSDSANHKNDLPISNSYAHSINTVLLFLPSLSVMLMRSIIVHALIVESAYRRCFHVIQSNKICKYRSLTSPSHSAVVTER